MGKVRRRRSIWVGIGVVIVFFAGVTLAVAWLGGGPDVPHPVEGDWSACTTCHSADALPDTHLDRVSDGCPSCHTEKRAGGSIAAGGAEYTASTGD